MDLRHMRYFIAVAEERSFTKAAARLHISQPPLSRQIRELEVELGVTLLNRTRHHIELSDAGQVFLQKARQILLATDAAVVQAQRAQRGEIGTLAIGFFEQIAYTLLPPTLRAFQERFPLVDVQLSWFPVIEQPEALRRGDVDLAFVRPAASLAGLNTEILLREPFVIALPADHRLADKNVVSIADCADERIISYVQHWAPDYHSIVMRLCALAGFAPQIVLELGQVYAAMGLVSSGMGISFVPASVQRVHVDKLVYRPLKEQTFLSETFLAWTHPYPSSLLSAFLDIAREVAQTQFSEPVAET